MLLRSARHYRSITPISSPFVLLSPFDCYLVFPNTKSPPHYVTPATLGTIAFTHGLRGSPLASLGLLSTANFDIVVSLRYPLKLVLHV